MEMEGGGAGHLETVEKDVERNERTGFKQNRGGERERDKGERIRRRVDRERDSDKTMRPRCLLSLLIVVVVVAVRRALVSQQTSSDVQSVNLDCPSGQNGSLRHISRQLSVEIASASPCYGL